VLSGASGNALAESESTLLSSRGVWEHLEDLEALVTPPRVSRRIVCFFQTD
jgi:hypothetical protein